MLARLRFRAYRWVMAWAMERDFAAHEVFGYEQPRDEEIRARPLDPSLPRLWEAENFPSTEHADKRVEAARRSGRLLPLVARLPAARTGPVPDDTAGLLEEIYPQKYRRLRAEAPQEPPELGADDVLAALAVSSPFALYLRRAATVADLPDAVQTDDFVIDMRLFDGRPVKDGLAAPGGLGVFRPVDRELRTKGIVRDGVLHTPGSADFERVQKLLLCALNTHLTTVLHNAVMHLGYVTPFSVATTSALGAEHPIRRLLHPALQTTLIGNYQLARFQIVGPRAFATTVFSHDHDTVMALIDEGLDEFRIAHFDPHHRLELDGIDPDELVLPLWEERLALWAIVLEYVTAYVGLYYADDAAVANDAELRQWWAELDRLLPAGLFDDEGYLPADAPPGRDQLTRVCATFLHVSSVTHDIVNNAVWNYSPLSHVIPTQVPESGEQQDVRVSFDFLTTLLGTWKEYNMLVDGVTGVALDDEAQRLTDAYIRALNERQARIDAAPPRPGRINPRDLNPSVSN